MSVLEETSRTRKDGRFLRWDKSGRDVAPKPDKGRLPSFRTALLKDRRDRVGRANSERIVFRSRARGAHGFLPGGAERHEVPIHRRGGHIAPLRQVRLHADARAGTGVARVRRGRTVRPPTVHADGYRRKPPRPACRKIRTAARRCPAAPSAWPTKTAPCKKRQANCAGTPGN